MTGTGEDLYALLGVAPDADPATLKAAFRARARVLHPDANTGGDGAAFARVRAAYETLADPARRAAYDTARAGRHGPAAAPNPAGRPAPPGARGGDVTVCVPISLAEAATGTRRQVRHRLAVVCDRCAGRSETGDGRYCGDCRGEGRRDATVEVDIAIPAGVEDGARLVLAGRGASGRRGGPPGDLVVAVTVAPHPSLRRAGADLRCVATVAVTEAALGAVVGVDTLEGPARIEIPAGTQPGSIIRLADRGMPVVGGGRGDLVVEIAVTVPTGLDAAQEALLRRLAALRGEHPAAPDRP